MRRQIKRDSGQSLSNAAQTVSSPLNVSRRLLFVHVKYSSSVTLNVTVTLNSGLGAEWDTLLQTIALSAASDAIWIPNEEICLMPDDVVDVLAPAGGVGVTSAVAIYSRAI